MNGEFFIDNKKYISAKRAANLTGYAMDYIGQLARAGKIDSRMIGRSWYVVEESLLGYKREVLDVAFSGKNIRKNRSLTKKKTSQKKRGRKPASEPQVVFEEVLQTAPIPAPEFLTSAPAAAPAPILLLPAPASVVVPAPVLAPIVPASVAVMPALKTISYAELVASRAGRTSVRIAKLKFEAKVAAENMALVEEAKAEEISPVAAIEPEAAVMDTQTIERAEKIRAERNAQPMFGDAIIDMLRGAGEFFLGSAFAFAVAVMILSSGSLYGTVTNGTLAVGADAKTAMRDTERVIARAPLYVHVGAAAVGRMVAFNGANSMQNVAGTSPTSSSTKLGFLDKVERFGARISGAFDTASLALVDGIQTLFGSKTHIEVKTTKLAVNADEKQADAPESPPPQKEGLVVVPSSGDAEKDAKVTGYIKDTFSDEVKVEKQNADGTGVIKPVFKSGAGDEYLYVIVPVQEGS